MKMKMRRILFLFLVIILPLSSYADLTITADYIKKDGTPVSTTGDITEEAPLYVDFTSTVSDPIDGASLEWHFHYLGDGGVSTVTRYEENTSYNFTASGLTVVALVQKLENEVIDSVSINVTISESVLKMPNAFTPNGDQINDVYKVKEHQSIVDFHAYIFNRWGQKLYDWTDIDGGWDGTFHGSDVKDGVYFVVVKAKGADGIEYNIRRDVNLIRKFNEITNSGGTE